MNIFRLLTLLLLLPALAAARTLPEVKLGPQASISLVTCSPGPEIYSYYGHTAIRVRDPWYEMDLVFNYGTFDFDTPNFYTKFVQGKLHYFLSVSTFPRFMRIYEYEGRGVTEQQLNLDSTARQQLYDYLRWNYQPENREYVYDFFFNNCATVIRDVLQKAIGPSLHYDTATPADNTFRDLIRPYMLRNAWVHWGTDVILGGVCDTVVPSRDYMFLPDGLSAAASRATIATPAGPQPLVRETRNLLPWPKLPPTDMFPINPGPLGWLLFALALAATVYGWRSGRTLAGLDAVFFSVAGLLGWLLVFLWAGTDHQTLRQNWNLLWAMPLHFPLALLYALLPRRRYLLARYFGGYAAAMVLLLALWPLVPQNYNEAFIPLVLALALRSGWLALRGLGPQGR